MDTIFKTRLFGDLQIINNDMKYYGIYVIYNKDNDKIYVGSSINIAKRIRQHKNALDSNSHSNNYLQNSFNSNNLNFIYLLLEKVKDKQNLITREQYWLDKTKCFKRENGYNIQIIADSPLGLKRTKESKLRMRNAQLGKKKTPEQREARKGKGIKIVYQYSLKGEYIRSWNGARELADYGFDETMISSCCSNNSINKTHKGFQWSHEKLDNIEKVNHSKNFPVVQLDSKGNYIKTWDNTKDISIVFNCKTTNITRCCNGDRETFKNFIWIYEHDYDINNKYIKKDRIPSYTYNSILQYDLKGNLIKIWNNVSDICKELNYNNSAIYQCIKNMKPQYKGYKWILNN